MARNGLYLAGGDMGKVGRERGERIKLNPLYLELYGWKAVKGGGVAATGACGHGSEEVAAWAVAAGWRRKTGRQWAHTA